MSLRKTGAATAALALSGLALFALEAPATAANCRAYPPSQGQCPSPTPAPSKSPKPTKSPKPSSTADSRGGGNQRQLRLTMSKTQVPAGGAVRAFGSGFGSGALVHFTMPCSSQSLGTFTASQAGTLDVSLTVPASTRPGRYRVTASGPGQDGVSRSVSADLQVGDSTADGCRVANGSGLSALNLPRTGTDIALVAAAGVGLVGAGAGAVFSGRRRRDAL